MHNSAARPKFLVIVALVKEATVECNLIPDARGLIRLHAGAANLAVENAAHREGVVADELALQTKTRRTREVNVLRIFRQFFTSRSGYLTVRGRHKHLLKNSLYVPAAIGKIA